MSFLKQTGNTEPLRIPTTKSMSMLNDCLGFVLITKTLLQTRVEIILMRIHVSQHICRKHPKINI